MLGLAFAILNVCFTLRALGRKLERGLMERVYSHGRHCHQVYR